MYLPCEHSLQDSCAVSSLYLPGTHASHPICPSKGATYPLGQVVHSDAPSCAVLRPFGQRSHTEVSSSLNLPIAHCMQRKPPRISGSMSSGCSQPHPASLQSPKTVVTSHSLMPYVLVVFPGVQSWQVLVFEAAASPNPVSNLPTSQGTHRTALSS